ncbi:IS5 family transposase [Streptomyces sp. NPDC001719]
MGTGSQAVLEDHKVLCGILFVLYTGMQWEWLPGELGFGSGITCWRRLRDWNNAGVWQLAARGAAGRAAGRQPSGPVAGGDQQFPCPGTQGRPKTGRSPVDRGRPGSKHHAISDATGIPLAVPLTGGRKDVTQLMPLLAAVPPIRGDRGRPRMRRKKVYADRGYDHDCYRRQVWAEGIKPVIARRGTAHGSGLGTKRWVVEQTIVLLHWFNRLRIRWETRDDIHEALLKLACSLICWRRLRSALRYR